MIYLLAPLAIVMLWHCVQIARDDGPAALARDLGCTLLAGLLAGVCVAIGAHLGIRLIALANGSPPRISWHGTSMAFALYLGIGVACALPYGVFLRGWLRRSGLAYGALLTVVTWYPLTHSGARQLATPLASGTLLAVSAAVVGLMWIPYGLALEYLLTRWRHAS